MKWEQELKEKFLKKFTISKLIQEQVKIQTLNPETSKNTIKEQ
jgi:hypothetical protein